MKQMLLRLVNSEMPFVGITKQSCCVQSVFCDQKHCKIKQLRFKCLLEQLHLFYVHLTCTKETSTPPLLRLN